jgi:MFS family permease
VLDLAPVGQRPTYVGLFNTISGVLIVLPPLGGWLLRTTSYGVLFGLTAALLILAHVLSLSLPSAHTVPELQPEPVT